MNYSQKFRANNINAMQNSQQVHSKKHTYRENDIVLKLLPYLVTLCLSFLPQASLSQSQQDMIYCKDTRLERVEICL